MYRCHKHDYAVHVNSISLNLGHPNPPQTKALALRILHESIPFIIRMYPDSFPFIYPSSHTRKGHNYDPSIRATSHSFSTTTTTMTTTGLLYVTTDPLWIGSCRDSRRRGRRGEVREIDTGLPVATLTLGSL